MRITEQQLACLLKRNGTPAAPAKVDTSQPPFALPPDIVLDLPPPISTNRLWRSTKSQNTRMAVYKSGPYKKWIKRADAMLVEMGQLVGVKPITGKFSALILLKPSALDLDNNSKCLLDFLQSRNFIVNDSLCQELTLRWGDAPTGARVTLRALA